MMGYPQRELSNRTHTLVLWKYRTITSYVSTAPSVSWDLTLLFLYCQSLHSSQSDHFTVWSQNVIPFWNFPVLPTVFRIKSKLLTVALKTLPNLSWVFWLTLCCHSLPGLLRPYTFAVPPAWTVVSPRSSCRSTEMSLSQRPSFTSLPSIFLLISFYPIVLLYFLQITYHWYCTH